MTNTLGTYFLLLLLAGTMVLTFFIFQPFLGALAMAAIFAVILQPVYRRILVVIPRWPSLASLLTVLVSVICILVPLGLVGTQVGIQAANLSTEFVVGDGRAQVLDVVQKLEDTAARYVPAAGGVSENISANISRYAQQALQWFAQHLGGLFAGLASLLLSFFIFFIALYYLLRDGSRVRETLIALSPLRDTYDAEVFDRLALAVNSVVRGNLTIALLQGVLSGIGFTLFGIPNSVLWGSVAAIAALIPGLGTGLVFVPIVIFAFVTGNTFGAIGLAAWGVIAVGLIDNLLAPRLIGSGIKIHPLLVLLSVLGGITFFGGMGIFLGPLSLSLLFTFLSIYSESAKSRTL